MIKLNLLLLLRFRNFKVLIRSIICDFKRKFFIYGKPRVVNFMVTDRCNSRCVMCNIWRTKNGKLLTPEQFSQILRNKLFSRVVAIGIAGGEPTLREDLPEIVRSVIDSLPKLQSVTLLSNALNVQNTIKMSKEIDSLCKANRKNFNLLLSLDGIGEVHDINRGIKGSYKNVIEVIEHLREKTDIVLNVGCTITKKNVWDVDEVLDFCLEKRLDVSFRIAEFINRLENNDLKLVIKNFDKNEKYHLMLFLKKLEFKYTINQKIQRRVYRNMLYMLEGGARKTGCIFNSSGIVLNEDGNLSYCSVASKILGNALSKSAYTLYVKNLAERRRIGVDCCPSCIHDNSEPENMKTFFHELKNRLLDYFWGLDSYKYLYHLSSIIRPYVLDKATVFIVGWYGTETVGDKAILGGIINYYKKSYKGNVNFVISSFVPFVTKRTIHELNVECKVILAKSLEFIRFSKSADKVVMGGGPLFDADCISVPLLAFQIARKHNKQTIVFGCGYGPLFSKKYISAVKKFFDSSSEIMLRDVKSVEKVSLLTNRKDIKLIDDMAFPFVKLRSKLVNSQNKNEIACYLKDLDHVYMLHLTYGEFSKMKSRLEQGIAAYLKEIRREKNIEKISFYHMHNFAIGGDDRDFSRRFIKTYFPNDDWVEYDKRLSTVDSIVSAMKSARLNICMRFHSVLFAEALNAPYYAIDYTNGGKIFHYLKDRKKIEKLIPLEKLIGNKIPIPANYYGQ